MKKLFFALGIFLTAFCFTVDVFAVERSFIYEAYDSNGGMIYKSFVKVKDLASNQKSYQRRIQRSDSAIIDEFTLDADGQTLTFKRTRDDEDTNYMGERKGTQIFIKGRLKGGEIEKTIDLKNKLFYNVPKFNLSKFALSGAPKVKFAILRKDKLKKMPMKAKNQGEGTVEVNGKMVEAIKVYYSATGIREKHYRRDYYFRKSDGMFIKKVEPDGSRTVLVSEK